MARVPAHRRWDPKLLSNIKGTPARPLPSKEDDAILEEHLMPHADADAELRELLEKEELDIWA